MSRRSLADGLRPQGDAGAEMLRSWAVSGAARPWGLRLDARAGGVYSGVLAGRSKPVTQLAFKSVKASLFPSAVE